MFEQQELIEDFIALSLLDQLLLQFVRFAVLVTVFVVINTLVDIAYALLDPRVKLGERAK